MRNSVEEREFSLLTKELSFLGLYTPDLIPAINTAMRNYQQEYIYRLRRMEVNDVTDYTMVLNLVSAKGLIEPESYQASVRITPSIAPGNYYSIDTSLLEKELAAITWDKDDALSAFADHSNSAISSLVHQVSELLQSEDGNANDIGQVLAARYWLHTPMENILDLSQVAACYDRCHQFPVSNLTTAINAGKARNLLLGRSVATLTEVMRPTWAYMDFSAAPNERLKYDNTFSVSKLLANYDLKELESSSKTLILIQGLMAGERMPVHQKASEGTGLVYVEADARNKVLYLFDTKGNPLPLDQYRVHNESILPLKIPEGPQMNAWLPPAQQKIAGKRP